MDDAGQEEVYDNEDDIYMDEEEEYEEYMAQERVNDDYYLAKSDQNAYLLNLMIDQANKGKN